MKKKLLLALSIVFFIPLALAIIGYLGVAVYYMNAFTNGTMINGVYAAGKTPAEVNELLVQKTDAATFCIQDKYEQNYYVPIEEMNFSYSYTEQLNQLLKAQNPFMWGVYLVKGQVNSVAINPTGVVDQSALHDYLMSMDLIKNQADPDNITVEIIHTRKGYELHDDTANLLDVDLTVANIEQAVLNGERSINLDVAGCYIVLEYDAKMEKTLKLWDDIEKLQGMTLTCEFYDYDEVMDASVISGWIALDEDGDFAYNEEGDLYIDEDAVASYVAEMAERHDSVGGPWTFNPTRGGTVTIAKGTYGYKLNQKAETELILEQLEARKDASEEAVYSQQGWGDSSGDIGNTYIEVDMTEQHMYYYQNGVLKLDTPVVTGNVNAGNGTPERVCYIYFKQRNRVLIGEDYRTPVSYWMAVYNNIGIHDASWRSRFGGTIYRGGGSHGCINTPTPAVAQLYEMAEVGTPVVIFY